MLTLSLELRSDLIKSCLIVMFLINTEIPQTLSLIMKELEKKFGRNVIINLMQSLLGLVQEELFAELEDGLRMLLQM